MEDNKRKLYDALSQDYDLGSFEQFSADIADDTKRRKLYDATAEEYDYGDYDSFSKQLGFGAEPSRPTPGTEQVGQVEQPARTVDPQAVAEGRAMFNQMAASRRGVSTMADAPQATRQYMEQNPVQGGRREMSREELVERLATVGGVNQPIIDEYEARWADYQRDIDNELGGPEVDAKKKWLDEHNAEYREAQQAIGEIEGQINLMDQPKNLETIAAKKAENQKHIAPKAISTTGTGYFPTQGEGYDMQESANFEAANNILDQTAQTYKQGSKYDSGYNGDWLEQTWTAARQFVEGGANNFDMGSLTFGLTEGSSMAIARRAGDKSNKIVNDTLKKLGYTDKQVNGLLDSVNEKGKNLSEMSDVIREESAALESMKATIDGWTRSQTELQVYTAEYNRRAKEFNKSLQNYNTALADYEKDAKQYESIMSAVGAAVESGLSDGEKAVLDALQDFTTAKMRRAKDVSIASAAGAGAEQSAEFMLDFILTGGLEKASTKLVSKWLLKDTAKELGFGGKVLADIISSAGRTAVMMPRNLAAYGENLVQMTGGVDNLGRYQFDRTHLNAALNTALNQYIEYWSEGFGEYFAAGERAAFKRITGSAPRTTIGKTLSQYRGNIGQYLDHGKFNGMFNEMLEEVVGAHLDALAGWMSGDRVGDKDAIKNFYSGEQMATLALSFLPMSAISAGTNIRAYNKMKERYDNAVATLNPFLNSDKITREELDELVSNIADKTPQEIAAKIVEITDNARKKNGGYLPNNFAQSLMGYVEGTFAMSLNNEAWENSQEKMGVVNAYTEQYSNPDERNAYDLAQLESEARATAMQAGFDDDMLDLDSYSIARHAQALQQSNPRQAQVLLGYAVAKSANQGLKDGYDEETRQLFNEIERGIQENSVNGNVIRATAPDGSLVFITSQDATVGANGRLSTPTGADGLVSYVDQNGRTMQAKASAFSGVNATPTEYYILDQESNFFEARNAAFEQAQSDISPAGMARALNANIGNTVFFRMNGIYEPMQVDRLTQGNTKVVVSGDPKFLNGLATMLGLQSPGGQSMELPIETIWPMLATNDDGSLATNQPEVQPAQTSAQPAATPSQPSSEPEVVNPILIPELNLGEDAEVVLDGNRRTVTILDVSDGKVYYEFEDENGDTQTRYLPYDDFMNAQDAAANPRGTEAPAAPAEQPQAPAVEETPAAEETPAEEAPQSKIPVDKDGNKIYDAPGVEPIDAYDDMYSTPGLSEEDVDEWVIAQSDEAEKNRNPKIKKGQSLQDWGKEKAEANRKADFWKQFREIAEERAKEREDARRQEAERQKEIEKYGVDTRNFDLTPQTVEEAVADYLGNNEGIIDLDDAKKEVFGKSGRIPSELFRHVGNGGILIKKGGRTIADVANDIVGEYEGQLPIEQDAVRDLIIDYLSRYTKTEMRNMIFNNRLNAALAELEQQNGTSSDVGTADEVVDDLPPAEEETIPAEEAVEEAPEGTDVPEVEEPVAEPAEPETATAEEEDLPEVEESGEQTAPENEEDTSETPGNSVPSQEEEGFQRPVFTLRNATEQAQARNNFVEAVGRRLIFALRNGTKKPYRSITDLRNEARAFGLEVEDSGATDILLQELVELALVKAARALTEQNGIKSKNAFDQICRLYELQPTIGRRSSERVAMQQYSTPLPMSFVAQMFAYNGEMKEVLEPTAGNGMLVFGIPGEKVHANELDDTRNANLQALGFGLVSKQDATEPFGGKYDAVIANPPFGSHDAVEFDGKQISGLDPIITLRALDAMKDGGKAAIIIGGNVEFADNGAWKTKKAFFSYLYDHYNVKGVVNMAGDLYAKQGTTYPTMMILIDGRRSEEERAAGRVYPPTRDIAQPAANTYDELYDIVKNILNDNRKTDGNETVRTEGERQPSDSQNGQPTLFDRGRGVESDTNGDNAEVPGQRGGNDSTPGVQRTGENAGAGARSEDAGVQGRPAGERQGTIRNVSGEEPVGNERGASDSGRGSVQETVSGRESNSGNGERVSDGTAGRKSDESLPGGKPSLRKPVRVEKKREAGDKNLSYVQHSGGTSLESVAPAAMAEAMDAALQKIEKEVGKSIDEFVMDELGYKTGQELYDALAAEQIDSVAMAIYQMKKGQAMIIGDQTGVGKGRQMAALIRWANRQGKTPIFFTQKAGLFSDMYRDLVDVGSSNLRPLIINSVSSDKDNSGVMEDKNGRVVYQSPSKEELKKILESGKVPDGYDYVVLSYSQLSSGDEESRKDSKKKLTINKQNANAVAKARFIRSIAQDNYVLLDESHTAAGADSNSGAFLQSIMPSVKGVTFASATFAKRPDTMPLYAIKSAISQANVEPKDLIQMIERGGVTLQEIMARALTGAGQMVRRERDMSDVKTDWETIDDPATSKRARENYDKAIKIFNDIISFQNTYITPVIDRISEDIASRMEIAETTRGTENFGADNPPFVNQTYNFTKQLMLALKVDAIVDRVVAEIKAGRHPVIALENTFGSLLDGYKAGDRVEDTSFSAGLIRSLEHLLQYTVREEDGQHQEQLSPEDLGEAGSRAYYALQDRIREATADIFMSPLDAITMKLNEEGYKVGEITGRDIVVAKDDSGYVIKNRVKDKKKAVREFNDGTLDVLIINKTGSTGISLHASKLFRDQRQRSMIIAQPLGDINDYMQMIGRIDRTGQVHRGYYINLSLPVPAELRFNMMLATKLKSLNANTTTSQESDAGSVEAPDFLNKYGSQVVVEYLRDHPDVFATLVATGMKFGGKQNAITTSEELEGYQASEDDAQKVTGRVALFPVAEQEAFYNDIAERYNALIKYLDETGENTLKITTLPLKAKTLARKVATEGRDPNGSNPFAQNSYVERVEVDVLKKPMKADEIRRVRESLLNGKTPQQREEELTTRIETQRQARIASENERYERKKEKLQKDIDKQVSAINAKNIAEADKKAEITRVTNRLVSAADVEAEHNHNIAAINNQHDRLRDRFQQFNYDETYLIHETISGGNLFEGAGVPSLFLGFKVAKDGDNLTPSTSFAVFATHDGRRRIEIKFTDGGVLDEISDYTNLNYWTANKTNLANWDATISNATREERYMLTGNILQAWSDASAGGLLPGRLISYTDIDGNIKDGILMNSTWETGSLRSSGKPIDQAKDQIEGLVWGDSIESTDGQVEIQKSRNFFLRVPKSKKDGAKYFQDERLVSLVRMGDFYQRRGKFEAEVSSENLPAVLQRLSELGVRVADESAENSWEELDQPQTDNDELLFRDGEEDGDIFVSNAAAAVSRISANKATPEQWLKMIEKEGGLKASEDKWIGLSDWLKASDKKTLTKQEVLDYINENKIQIEETRYEEGGDIEQLRRDYPTWDEAFYIYENDFGEPEANIEDLEAAVELYNSENITSPWLHVTDGDLDEGDEGYDRLLDWANDLMRKYTQGNINSTRLDYTTEGLSNKREIALTVPTIEPWNTSDEIHFGDAGNGRAVAWVRFGETTDSAGRRVLVIDEIQSKRHQEGREQGYKEISDKERQAAVDARNSAHSKWEQAKKDVNDYLRSIFGENYNVAEGSVPKEYVDAHPLTDEQNMRLAELSYAVKQAEREFDEAQFAVNENLTKQKSDIPMAPFEKNWHELAMKRMLRLAAEEGYDYVAWTTGDQQAKRYSIGHVIEGIETVQYHDGSGRREVYLTSPARPDIQLTVDKDGTVIRVPGRGSELKGKQLQDIIGKELAIKTMNTETDEVGNAELVADGQDLMVGGEGMRGFYDEILPRFMNKYGKKWGVSVSDITLPNVEEAGRTMHVVPVTPEMKASVMQGQPMFREDPTAARVRQKEDPKKTIKVYKLMRLWGDGKLYPLFIDSSAGISIGEWYDAESPDLDFLKKMPSGVFLVNPADGSYTSLEDYANEHGFKAGKFPPKDAINEASVNGMRWVKITDTEKGQRRYEGENRKYENIGINGSGGVSTFAMRPGWHAGSLPTMRQIGKGPQKNLRDNSFVWVEGEVPADVDYNAEAQSNPDNDIPTHIPTDGYYMKSTNANAKAAQADKVGWYVAGSFKANRIISDAEARAVIDEYNAAHPNQEPVEYDYARESGREFTPEERRISAAEREVTNATLDRMSDELGIKINRVSRDQMPKGHKSDKGYYNPSTGEMTICMDNVTDERDAIATVLHETVGHHGLRKLFGDRFNGAMARIYAALDQKGRTWVNGYIVRHPNTDNTRAVEEYLSHLAESGDFKNTVWDNIKRIIGRIVDALFGTNGFLLTDNELDYILRASYENLKNPNWLNTAQGKAFDTLLKRQLGINETDPNKPTDPQGPDAGRLYRDGDSGVANDDYNLAVDSWENKMLTENQDADRPVRIGMDKVMKEKGIKSISEDEDYVTRHNLASSRAESEAHEFELFRFTPLMDQVRAIQSRLLGKKATAADREQAYQRILDYMYAVSGLERNASKNAEIEQAKQAKLADAAAAGITDPAKLAEIEKKYDDMKRDWSGLTSLMGMSKDNWQAAETAAQGMISAFESAIGDKAALDELWNRVRACTDFSLEHAYQHGLLTREEFERLHGTASQPRMWEYYLPLRGFSETTAEEQFSYETFTNPSRGNVVVKKMNGRWTQADNPLANILNIAETEIVQGNDNWAKQALYRFTLNAGDNTLLSASEPWFVKNPATGKWSMAFPDPGETLEEFEERMKALRALDDPLAKKGRRGLKLDNIMANKAHRNEHAIHLKVGGIDKMIWVNGNPALAKAVSGIGRAQNLQWLRRAGRVLSNLFTTYSLDFTAKNLIRDTVYSNIALMVKEDRSYRHQYRKNWIANFGYGVFAFPMVRLAAEWDSGKLQQKEKAGTLTKREQDFLNFMRDGGQTGYTIINSVNQIKKDLEKQMRSAGGRHGTVPILGWYAKAVKTLNEGFELLTRFTAYQTSRDMGRSGQRAASDAKEISVNFNRRGAQSGSGVWGNIAAYLGATHYFYNAGVQGFDNFLALFRKKPVKMSAITAGFVIMGVLTPLINSMLAGLIGGGDGDDDWYWNLPEWVRRNNIIINTGKFYFAIPLPVEFRAPYGIGDIAGAAFAYEKYANRKGGLFPWANLSLDILNTASGILPVNPVEGYTSNGNIGDAIIRAVAPDAGMFFVDWATNRDYTGRPLWKENPFSDTVPKSQGAYASTPKGIVAACQKLAEVSNGAIDVAPGLVRDFMQNYGGGFFRAAEDVSKLLFTDVERPRRWDNVPFFSGFTGHIDEDRSKSFAQNALYEYKKLSEDNVRSMNAILNTDEVTSAVLYDEPESLYEREGVTVLQKAKIKRMLDSKDYALGKMYREGMNNKYKMKQRMTGAKAGQWYKSREVERKGVNTLRQEWKDLRDQWAKMPDKTEEQKSAKAEMDLKVQEAWHLYYDAMGDLAEKLMDYEYNK